MHLMTQSEAFTLCDADIDAFSEWLNNILPDAGLDRKNCLRVRLLALLMLLWFSVRMRVGLFTAVKKLWKPFWLALCGAPVDETIESAETVCASQLGIDRGFAKICLPQGMVLFMPISAVGTLIFTLYLLNVYQIHLDTVWLVITVLLIEFLFVATPPVPGQTCLRLRPCFPG